jgi:hypothetical protein
MLRSSRRVVSLLSLLPLLICPLSADADEKGEIFRSRRAEVAPFPREVPLGKQIGLSVKPAPKHHSPKLAITAPDGSTRYVSPEGPADVGGWHSFRIDFEKGKGAYRFELVVDSPRGDTSAAQFTIWVGVPRPKDGEGEEEIEPRPDSAYPPEPADTHLLVLERKLFRLVNDYRTKHRLAPFPWLEEVAVMGRAHLLDYLKMKPRPKELTHLIPGYGSIADRFEDQNAAETVRKFPVRDPEIGPTAVSYISESLAAMRSVEWLFREYYLRESAFRKPVISKYPTHAAVAMIRDEKSGYLYSAFVYVQVNATRVLDQMEKTRKETVKLESRARDPDARAVYLRKLGRQADPKSITIFRRRLGRNAPPAVRAAALDALLLNDPEQFDKWVKQQESILRKARESEDYGLALPVLLAYAQLEWHPRLRTSGEREVRFVTRLAEFEVEAAEEQLAAGDRAAAIERLEAISKRFPGLAAAEKAKRRRDELSDDD